MRYEPPLDLWRQRRGKGATHGHGVGQVHENASRDTPVGGRAYETHDGRSTHTIGRGIRQRIPQRIDIGQPVTSQVLTNDLGQQRCGLISAIGI